MTRVLTEEETRDLLTIPIAMEVLEEAFIDVANGVAMSDERVDRHAAVEVSEIATHFGWSVDELRRKVANVTSSRGVYVEAEALSASHLVYLLKTMSGLSHRHQVAALRTTSMMLAMPRTTGSQRLTKVPLGEGFRYTAPVFLFSMVTGELLGIVPDAVLQRNRVVATSAIATQRLSRTDSHVVGLLGSGSMAEGSVIATSMVRSDIKFRVFSPTEEHRISFAKRMEENGVGIEPVSSAEEACSGADIVIDASNVVSTSKESAKSLHGEWLESGSHLDSINLASADAECFRRADIFAVTWRGWSGGGWRVRDYGMPADREKADWYEYETNLDRTAGAIELGDVLTGRHPGRVSDGQRSFFLNTSAGIQFAACGARLLELAEERGVGTVLPSEYFLQEGHP